MHTTNRTCLRIYLHAQSKTYANTFVERCAHIIIIHNVLTHVTYRHSFKHTNQHGQQPTSFVRIYKIDKTIVTYISYVSDNSANCLFVISRYLIHSHAHIKKKFNKLKVKFLRVKPQSVCDSNTVLFTARSVSLVNAE